MKEEGAKRTLSSIIDVNQYVVSKGTRKVYREKLILREDGKMNLNSTFIKKIPERDFAVAFSKDFKEVLLIPDCEREIHFSKTGCAMDVELVRFLGKKKPFPLVYELSWMEDKKLWHGVLNQTTKE